MERWPDDVSKYYQALANERGWGDEVREPFFEMVDFYRQLEEQPSERRYFLGVDGDEHWYFETVTLQAQLVPIKQVVVVPDGEARLYSWSHLEDDDGGLSESALDASSPALSEISAEAFAEVWTPLFEG